jgi:CRP-like cAMP-binding protein
VPESAYFVKSGLVALRATDASGAEESLSVRGPGFLVCGEALMGAPSPTTVQTLTAAVMCAARAETIRTWLGPQKSPGNAIATLLLSDLSQKQADASGRTGRSLSRVARFLLACERGHAPREGLRKHVLASVLGIRAETLSRCLRTLRDQGVLAEEPSLRVLDVAALEAIAEQEEPLGP